MKKLSKTASTIIWAFAYFGLTIALTISGTVAFHRYYYCSIFVSGTSMEPTLKGGGFHGNSGIAHYGIIDVTDHALKGIKRFDIITTYYPWDKSDYKLEVDPETGEEYYEPGHEHPDGVKPDRKIKRVIGLPGETLRIYDGDIVISKLPTVVTEPKPGKNYKMGILPHDNRSYKMKVFKNADSSSFYCDPNFDLGFNVTLEKTTVENEYYLQLFFANENHYLNIKKGTNGGLYYSYDMSPSTIWKFDSKYNGITTKIDFYKSEGEEYILANYNSPGNFFMDLIRVSELKEKDASPANFLARNDDETVVYSRELIKGNESYVNYEKLKDYKNNYAIPFAREFDGREYNIKDQLNEIVLMEDRYWVQGDHWSSSTDCGDAKRGPIYYENIEGVLVAIEGTCEIRTDSNGNKECINHKRMIPKLL